MEIIFFILKSKKRNILQSSRLKNNLPSMSMLHFHKKEGLTYSLKKASYTCILCMCLKRARLFYKWNKLLCDSFNIKIMFASCCKMFNFFHCKGRPHKCFCSQSSPPPPHKHCRCFLLCCYSSSRALKTQCCLCTSIMNAAATCIDVQLFNVYIYLMHI